MPREKRAWQPASVISERVVLVKHASSYIEVKTLFSFVKTLSKSQSGLHVLFVLPGIKRASSREPLHRR
jgi:hypothetical protein